MQIRKSTKEDLSNILGFYAHAREFMKSYGNPNQWGDSWPAEDVVVSDIENGDSYLVIGDDGKAHAVFALIFESDPNYSYIDGKWPDDEPYAVIHRIASDGKIKGTLHEAVRYAKGKIGHIRIDTHKLNAPMLRAIEKEGFAYCGVINLLGRDGDDSRLAFALTVSPLNS